MNTYKVYYRYKGQTDNTFEQASDELGAKASLLKKIPSATPTKAVLFKEGDPIADLRPLAPVIDIFTKKRVA